MDSAVDERVVSLGPDVTLSASTGILTAVGFLLVTLPLVDVAAGGRAGQIVSLGAASAGLLVAVYRDPGRARMVLLAGLVSLLMLASVLWGTGQHADLDFMVRGLLLVPLLFLLGALCGRRPRLARSFSTGVVLASLAAVGFVFSGQGGGGLHHVELGRVTAMGLALVWIVPFPVRAKNVSLVRGLSATALVAGTALTGARGPLVVGLVVGVVVALLSRHKSGSLGTRARTVVVGFFLAAGVVAGAPYFLRSGLDLDSLERQAELFQARPDQLASGVDRWDNYYTPAFEIIGDDFWGSGLPVDVRRDIDGADHPHNLLLEVGVAWGVLGLLVAVAGLIWFLGLVWKLRNDRPYMVAVGLYAFLNSMFSENLVGNRWVFFAVGALVFATRGSSRSS